LSSRYVILGNGIAGQTCAEELRKTDSESQITMIAAERYPLYNRVALPRYLRGQVREEKVLMRSVDDYANQGLDVHFETWATEIDPRNQVVRTNRGQEFPYDGLLVATGGRPKPAPWPGADQIEHLYAFQTLDETRAIIHRVEEAEHVLVMGASFIAYELAEGIIHRGKRVTWMMRGPRFLRYILDQEGGELCRRMGAEMGVEFILDDEVTAIRSNGKGYCAITATGRDVDFDTLCYGVGLDYYTEPLAGTGVELRRGVVTDAKLRTNVPNIYAAGDIAVFHDLMLEKHNQMGTWDNAMAHGKVVAHNLAGAEEDFFDVPTYTTTMFGSTMAVMGVTPDVQPGMESVRTFSFEEKFYRQLFFIEDRLVGAIMIGPPKGRKRLIEIMQQRQPVGRAHEDLLDPANLQT